MRNALTLAQDLVGWLQHVISLIIPQYAHVQKDTLVMHLQVANLLHYHVSAPQLTEFYCFPNFNQHITFRKRTSV